MNYLENGFNFNVEINKITAISPRKAGEFKTANGDIMSYGFAVKFRSMNLIESKDDDGFFRETEFYIEIEIPCENDSQVRLISDLLREIRSSGVTLNLPISSVSKGEKGYHSAKSLLCCKDFIEKFSSKKQLKKDI